MPSPDPPTTTPPQPQPQPQPQPRAFHPPTTALLIYPATLLIGSLFSVLSPTAQGTRDHALDPHAHPFTTPGTPLAPSPPVPHPVNYFARKDNLFNIYFVKIGWLWTTLAFALLLLSQPAYTAFASQHARIRRTGQALLRYVLATTVWYLTTQWFFGPPVIDRSFVLTGGKCERVVPVVESSVHGEGEDVGVKTLLTAVACKSAGGAWRGGHDVSGHVFLLVLAVSLVVFEGVGAARGGGGGSEKGEGKEREEEVEGGGLHGLKVWCARFAWAVAGLGWWMLLMTAIWFHTWFEKFTGLLIALATVYTIYILPRRVIPWRDIVGLPGV
ncbi:hypothetical protein BO70DRAFT_118799 [Aspergillus heteromorphus CBS 117.55]|uniref:Acyl-coenzyme A diphosphatase SCS3 n=1 Tax=Aspergillus heteromorphus CBS 117.55 TaxID=1448321 RepID=A0A317VDQ6_9EURO|nr:uncharacterized protein BO70DRAFT_118799 [Aspergillus heteromorphus CBS 117.55]PWY72426.1 hypothetical protein BO70DRAFT_118799 [Aspergillus heteromorphus CBS 117.55]